MLSYMSIEIPLDVRQGSAMCVCVCWLLDVVDADVDAASTANAQLISVAGCSCLTYFVIGLSLEDAYAHTHIRSVMKG